jgi:hypothetical protein
MLFAASAFALAQIGSSIRSNETLRPTDQILIKVRELFEKTGNTKSE